MKRKPRFMLSSPLYSDALSNAHLTFDAIFYPMIVDGLPERFRYMKDRLYSQYLNGAFPTYDEVHLTMQTYDLNNNRSVESPSLTPSGPTILAANTDAQPICTICRKPFPRVLSKVSDLPFQSCQPCNYKARNPTVATAQLFQHQHKLPLHKDNSRKHK